jgi:hypothetical protein
MNLNFEALLPENFDDSSRVWIYQSSRLFTMSESLQIEDLLKHFVSSWNSHGDPVKGYANLFFGQFIVLIADETGTGVSGCSTDSSVRLVKDIERMFQVNLFDRLMLAFLVKEKVQMVPFPQLPYALENDFIDASTIYFNNTVLNLQQLKNNWLVPVKSSWLNNDKRYSILINKNTAV